MLRGDVDAAIATGVSMVNLSVPVSDVQIAASSAASAALRSTWSGTSSNSRGKGLSVAVGGEDSSRRCRFSDRDHCRGEAAGARRFRVADTQRARSDSSYALMAALRATTDLELEFHGHDDLGLATANTLAAIKAGATHASVTVIGLGERAGNARWRNGGRSRATLWTTDRHRAVELGNVAAVVAAAAARTIPLNKAIVGDHVFTHESGIHVDGLLKDQRTTSRSTRCCSAAPIAS